MLSKNFCLKMVCSSLFWESSAIPNRLNLSNRCGFRVGVLAPPPGKSWVGVVDPLLDPLSLSLALPLPIPLPLPLPLAIPLPLALLSANKTVGFEEFSSVGPVTPVRSEEGLVFIFKYSFEHYSPSLKVCLSPIPFNISVISITTRLVVPLEINWQKVEHNV